MGPGRYTPVVYQAKREHGGSKHQEQSYSTDKGAQPQKRLEAMRVRAAQWVYCLWVKLSDVCFCNKHPDICMQWGLIPSFTKPNAKPDHFIMFNARYVKFLQSC